MVVNMRRINERFQDGHDSSLIKQLGVVGSIGVDRTTLFGGDTNNSGGRRRNKYLQFLIRIPTSFPKIKDTWVG